MSTTSPLLVSEGMGPISGSDPEDGLKGNGDIFEITDLSGMNGNVLFYDANMDGIMDNGEVLSPGDVITNYNPNKLSVSFMGVGSVSFLFEYITYDEAGAPDPTPALYEVIWRIGLPVEMLYFNAYANECLGVLMWATASEENNSHFMIESSTDGENFTAIGRVKGAGNSANKISYSFEVELEAERTYFRLKQVDYDGSFEYSEVQSIRLNPDSRCIRPLGTRLLYPNPNNGKFSFEIMLENEAEGVTFHLIDILGQRLKTYDKTLNKGKNLFQFNLENYDSGLYFLEVSIGQTLSAHRIILVDEN